MLNARTMKLCAQASLLSETATCYLRAAVSLSKRRICLIIRFAVTVYYEA